MRKWHFHGLLSLLSIFLLAGSMNAVADDAVVSVYNDYYPYTLTQNGGSGVVIELTKLVFAEMHRDVVLKISPLG